MRKRAISVRQSKTNERKWKINFEYKNFFIKSTELKVHCNTQNVHRDPDRFWSAVQVNWLVWLWTVSCTGGEEEALSNLFGESILVKLPERRIMETCSSSSCSLSPSTCGLRWRGSLRPAGPLTRCLVTHSKRSPVSSKEILCSSSGLFRVEEPDTEFDTAIALMRRNYVIHAAGAHPLQVTSFAKIDLWDLSRSRTNWHESQANQSLC